MDTFYHYWCCLDCNEMFEGKEEGSFWTWAAKHQGHIHKILNEHDPKMDNMKNFDGIKKGPSTLVKR